MKVFSSLFSLVFAGSVVYGQGTVIFDQQTDTSEFSPPYGNGGAVQSLVDPWGQSFTPALSGIDFIRLLFDDGNPNDGQGATAYITLRSGAINGPIIGTTPSVTMPNGFSGVSTFTFPASVPLVPGTTYFFNPVVQDYSDWYILPSLGLYAGGHAYNGGMIASGTELWFREGIFVPEPSPLALAALAAATLAYTRRKR